MDLSTVGPETPVNTERNPSVVSVPQVKCRLSDVSEYVHVYRKSFCMVSPELFNKLTSLGLLDEKHLLGE